MSRRNAVTWTVIALIGLVVAGGVSMGVRALTTEDVGLTSEPITAGKELAPPVDRAKERARARERRRRAARRAAARRRAVERRDAPPATAPVTPPAVADGGDDDDGGKGRGRGRGRGGDDSDSDDSGGGSDDDDSGSSGQGSDDSGDDD